MHELETPTAGAAGAWLLSDQRKGGGEGGGLVEGGGGKGGDGQWHFTQ